MVECAGHLCAKQFHHADHFSHYVHAQGGSQSVHSNTFPTLLSFSPLRCLVAALPFKHAQCMVECADKLYAKRETSSDAVHGFGFALAAMMSAVPSSSLGIYLAEPIFCVIKFCGGPVRIELCGKFVFIYLTNYATSCLMIGYRYIY